MEIIHSDNIFRVEPNTSPNYNSGNSLLKLIGVMERTRLAAEREFYVMDQAQYLFPFDYLELYGPQSPNSDVLDPAKQDSKVDFQKQNVRDFHLADAYLTRGLVNVGNWTGPFLRVSYRGGPDSKLSSAANHQLGDRIKLWIRVGAITTSTPITAPYNPESDRYEVELWGFPGNDLRSQLDVRGQSAIDRGELIVRPDLIKGQSADFAREGLNDKYLITVSPDHTLHPILPLHIEVAWANQSETDWDSKGGANYQYEFNMKLRGWDNFLSAGISPNPHGGIGFLEYRNLLSNYGRYNGSNELGRTLEAWNFNAFGNKNAAGTRENFMAVDYMDLHILKTTCGIGLHRHRDNQEVFLMLAGRGLMVVGDWLKLPERERCFEIRTLRAGHFAMLKGGQLHALLNPTDEDISLFMFGGYD